VNCLHAVFDGATGDGKRHAGPLFRSMIRFIRFRRLIAMQAKREEDAHLSAAPMERRRTAHGGSQSEGKYE
jgi:hypothetical protein